MGRWLSNEDRLEVVLRILRSVSTGRHRTRKTACLACGVDPYSFVSLRRTAIKYIEREGIELTDEDLELLYGRNPV